MNSMIDTSLSGRLQLLKNLLFSAIKEDNTLLNCTKTHSNYTNDLWLSTSKFHFGLSSSFHNEINVD